MHMSFDIAYLVIHRLTVSLGYFAFFVASVASALYLIQDHALKHKRGEVIFSRLPNLDLLDKCTYRSIGLGFPLLTISILSGLIWAKNIHGVYWGSCTSRQVYGLILWLIYAVILHVRLSARLRGKKVALLSLAAFAVIILTLLGTCR